MKKAFLLILIIFFYQTVPAQQYIKRSDIEGQKLFATILLKYPNLEPIMIIDSNMYSTAKKYAGKFILTNATKVIVSGNVEKLDVIGEKLNVYLINLDNEQWQFAFSDEAIENGQQVTLAIKLYPKYALLWILATTI